MTKRLPFQDICMHCPHEAECMTIKHIPLGTTYPCPDGLIEDQCAPKPERKGYSNWPIRRSQLLALIAEHQPVASSDLAELANVHQSTISKWIRRANQENNIIGNVSMEHPKRGRPVLHYYLEENNGHDQ